MQKLFSWASKWWPGLIPLAVMWGFAAWNNTLPVEADLSARSSAALKETVLDKTRIAVDGRDVSLAADAFSEEGRRDAVMAVELVPGVRLVDDRTRLVPEAAPFVWNAERDVVRVTLSGSAPLPSMKARLTEAARKEVSGTEVADQMGLARGAPPRFEAAAMLLLDQIGKLKDGKITISDTKVNLSGMARDLGGREAIAAALKNLPEGFSVAANDVKAPPYIFQAYKDPVAATVTMTGYVPDNSVHAAIATSASRKFFTEKVVDNLKASVGAPGSFNTAVVAALGALSRLSTGTLVVSDREVKLSGDALYEGAANDIRAGLGKDFPKNWQYKPEITVKPAAGPVDGTVCQQLFSELLNKGKIRFATKRADIDPDSAGILDHLIETALRCPTTNIEVAGHTDADGEDSFNQALSEKRAQAVIDYLVKAGLPATRFTPVGYGATQPLAGNDTDEGKAQNRRIEFLVR
ncbi:OmpA family protein [Bradyrhizobium japonicum]|uniref:OmpA family protein n=1 Tax=Bradyrhizobium japonicum TaxID=375 RepID=UPI00209FEDC7|nr:OmpA family protein [Bradyrhizobium japonicum]MCP1762042.1 OOP family OmpA-OmpF porin [Bradyrhizobium japonicum]MCP1793622.1 OOP family OmpA-OmpF porin [Bradyrhizobium japonicum]MCP1806055.1 OOP family OmpA-OmpF porin [Bradyrhizobium japonicum]MCP1814983.1 OOP family OmpA-OmpF porin [Bradyrhizobium japonicum]MCP1873499.1 OOP family OmpA-OmpF porin [Bradyrhizobium japonicum]